MKSVKSEAGMKIPPPYLWGSVASWTMDEESWDGVSYDVEDTSDNENDGIADGGATTTEDADLDWLVFLMELMILLVFLMILLYIYLIHFHYAFGETLMKMRNR